MSIDPKLQRIWDAYTIGYRSIRPNNLQWIAALTEAAAIAQHYHQRYEPEFVTIKPLSAMHDKLPAKYVDGTHVAVPHNLILSLETTWAELDYQASELDVLAAEIKDDIFRAKIQQTISELKLEIERKKRQNLKVVP